MRISVTEDHIKKGRKREPRFCPVAIAVRERLKLSEYQVDVGNRIWIKDFPVEIPHAVNRFVSDFDNGRPVEPFEFDLDYA